MSVYIKGMEMPTRCAECWLMDGEDGWCTACRGRHLYPEYRYGIKDRPDWCPLVPVSEHGRLIDADALGIREAEKQAYEAYLREKGEFFIEETLLEYMRGRLDGLINASGRVRFAPTIIPADPADKEGEG